MRIGIQTTNYIEVTSTEEAMKLLEEQGVALRFGKEWREKTDGKGNKYMGNMCFISQSHAPAENTSAFLRFKNNPAKCRVWCMLYKTGEHAEVRIITNVVNADGNTGVVSMGDDDKFVINGRIEDVQYSESPNSQYQKLLAESEKQDTSVIRAVQALAACSNTNARALKQLIAFAIANEFEEVVKVEELEAPRPRVATASAGSSRPLPQQQASEGNVDEVVGDGEQVNHGDSEETTEEVPL